MLLRNSSILIVGRKVRVVRQGGVFSLQSESPFLPLLSQRPAGGTLQRAQVTWSSTWQQ